MKGLVRHGIHLGQHHCIGGSATGSRSTFTIMTGIHPSRRMGDNEHKKGQAGQWRKPSPGFDMGRMVFFTIAGSKQPPFNARRWRPWNPVFQLGFQWIQLIHKLFDLGMFRVF